MAQVYDQRASADARPWSAHTGTNYGDEIFVSVGEWSAGDIGETYVNFSLSGLPSRFRVYAAYLSLFQYDDVDDWQSVKIQVAAELCASSWTELGITWGNKPLSVGGYQALLNVYRYTSGNGDTSDEYRWDVTNHMVAVGNGAVTWNGFRVRYTGTSSSTAKYFRSREYGTASKRPRLYMLWDYPFGKCKVSGIWRNIIRAQGRVSGAWRNVTSIKVNVSGTWRNIT